MERRAPMLVFDDIKAIPQRFSLLRSPGCLSTHSREDGRRPGRHQRASELALSQPRPHAASTPPPSSSLHSTQDGFLLLPLCEIRSRQLPGALLSLLTTLDDQAPLRKGTLAFDTLKGKACLIVNVASKWSVSESTWCARDLLTRLESSLCASGYVRLAPCLLDDPARPYHQEFRC